MMRLRCRFQPTLKPGRVSPLKAMIAIMGIALFSACASVELESAFKGEFPAEKNNAVISNYCQTCHIHKDFDGESHVLKVRETYSTAHFRRASECRTCHYLEKEWVHNNYQRKTRMPSRSKPDA